MAAASSLRRHSFVYYIQTIIYAALFISIASPLFLTNAFELQQQCPASSGRSMMKPCFASVSKPAAATSGRAGLSDRIVSMLSRMTTYFYSMVDPRTGRFYYRCLPESGRRIHGHCPIRDLGSAWDTTTLLSFWKMSRPEELSSLFGGGDKAIQSRLSTAVLRTIQAYDAGSGAWLTIRDDKNNNRTCAAIPSKVLGEPTDIAHSAFLILATNGALKLSLAENNDSILQCIPVNNLVNGILSMQQQDSGAFAIQFGDPNDIWRGIEFYPGEAILALLDAYELSGNDTNENALSPSTRNAIVPAAQRAFLFYSDFYRQGNVEDHYTSFFGNWQVQAFARLFDALQGAEGKSSSSSMAVAEYIFELCDAIVISMPWKELLRGSSFDGLSTVEIACGLEALADGIRIANKCSSLNNNSQRVDVYWQHVKKAVEFLSAVQDQVPVEAVGSGGLGYSLGNTEQRLDVTGHAVNALVKVHSALSTAVQS